MKVYLVVKGFNGFDYKLSNGKIISLRGGCALNQISKADLDLLIKEYPSVQDAIDGGFYIVNGNEDTAKKQSQKAVDEVKDDTANKQEEAQAENEGKTNTKLAKQAKR